MHLRRLKVCLLIVLVPATLAFGQELGAKFDPTPVTIPKADSASPRPITSADLVALREVHGMSISPNGEWVAFIVGQANYETNSYRSGLYVVRTSGEEQIGRAHV